VCGGVPARNLARFPFRNLIRCFALLAGLACFAGGCKTRHTARPSSAQTHQITQELAKAAAQAAPADTLIKSRRRNRGSNGTLAPDEVYIGVRGNSAALTAVQQSLSGVATEYGLTMDAPTQSGSRQIMTLRSAGIVTHRVELELLGPRQAEAAGAPSAAPRLAILLDDLGSNQAAAEEIFALHLPITISVLPYHEHSREIAQAAKRHGCEVMLHLPMQSLANESPEQQELRPGLSREQVESMVDAMLEAVPEADGVNNHQGSQATANGQLMGELMPVLKEAGVFYVDSRTTAATVAYDAAKQAGVKTAFRNTPFLDDVQESGAVKRQLSVAIRKAKEKGEVIAIGHPHPATLSALREMLPQARAQGVRLVLVSELVR